MTTSNRFGFIEQPSGNWIVLPVSNPPVPKPGGGAQWYVPYTAVHPRTAKSAPSNAIWVDVRHSPNAYYAALSRIWLKRQTFAILEHDCVCRPDIVESFEDCPELWCTYGYHDVCHPECQEAWRNQLGCVRFRRQLLEAVPDAMSSIPEAGWGWANLCDGLGANLRAAGYTHHWHGPPVEHHRETHKL